jgi:hypothetical protein
MFDTLTNILEHLPHGIRSELLAGVLRTGWTPQLERAALVLAKILIMAPEEFEQYASQFIERR